MSHAVARVDARRLALAYLELTKPNIVMLVMLTGVPALLMAARGLPDVRTVAGAILGTVLAAASAAAFNHVFDRDIDAVMLRTRNRPLPTGVIAPAPALGFAFVLAALAWWVLIAWTNPLAAVIGMLSIVYYAVVYTLWLKRATSQNIVIGGGAGATAPLIAWAAVTGRIDLPAVLLAAIVFFWTPPHFWALALYRREDYARARIPMLPVTHGEAETRRQILLYTLGLVPITLGPVLIGSAGWIYGVPALLLGGTFAWFAWKLYRTAETPRAVRLFRFSILYLFVLFVALGVDAAVAGMENQRGAAAARAAAAQAAASAPVRVTLTARIAGDSPVLVTFSEVERVVRRGAEDGARLRLDNPTDRPIGVAVTPSVRPVELAAHVREAVGSSTGRLTIPPGGTWLGPLRFVLDPALPAAVESITIDYSIGALPPDD